jgi:hypothetical protein
MMMMICIHLSLSLFNEAVDLNCPSKIRSLFGFNFLRIVFQHFDHKNFESAVHYSHLKIVNL